MQSEREWLANTPAFDATGKDADIAKLFGVCIEQGQWLADILDTPHNADLKRIFITAKDTRAIRNSIRCDQSLLARYEAAESLVSKRGLRGHDYGHSGVTWHGVILAASVILRRRQRERVTEGNNR